MNEGIFLLNLSLLTTPYFNLYFQFFFSLKIVKCEALLSPRGCSKNIQNVWFRPVIGFTFIAMRFQKNSLPDDIGFSSEIWRWIHPSGSEFFYSNLDGENEIYQTKTATSVFTYFYNKIFCPSSWPRHILEVLEKPKRFSC